MRNGRILQAIGATVVGLALAAGPVTMASAKSHKPKHHSTKVNPAGCKKLQQVSAAIDSVSSSESKTLEGSVTNFAQAKSNGLAGLNTAIKKEQAAEGAMSNIGAPKNAQNALKGIFSITTTLKNDLQNASSAVQLAESLGTSFAGKAAQLQSDATTLASYFESACAGG